MDTRGAVRRVAFLLSLLALAAIAVGALNSGARAHAAVVQSRAAAPHAELSAACFVSLGECSLVPCVEFIDSGAQSAVLSVGATAAGPSPRPRCPGARGPLPLSETQITRVPNGTRGLQQGPASVLPLLLNRLAGEQGHLAPAPRR